MFVGFCLVVFLGVASAWQELQASGCDVSLLAWSMEETDMVTPECRARDRNNVQLCDHGALVTGQHASDCASRGGGDLPFFLFLPWKTQSRPRVAFGAVGMCTVVLCVLCMVTHFYFSEGKLGLQNWCYWHPGQTHHFTTAFEPEVDRLSYPVLYFKGPGARGRVWKKGR
jgi:hypothetical protein